VSGYDGTGLYFDGTNDYVEITDSDNLDFSGTLTMEATIQLVDSSTWKTIICKDNAYKCMLAPNEQLYWGMWWDGEGSWSQENTGYTITTGVWSTVVIVYNRDAVKTWVNGTLVHTYSVDKDIQASGEPLRIGTEDSSSNFFIGNIDEVYVAE